jgi:hypothetical protein
MTEKYDNCLSWDEREEHCDEGYPVTCPHSAECAGVPDDFPKKANPYSLPSDAYDKYCEEQQGNESEGRW